LVYKVLALSTKPRKIPRTLWNYQTGPKESSLRIPGQIRGEQYQAPVEIGVETLFRLPIRADSAAKG
jgi:hypothetical protein